jgi:transposase-like protein
MNTNNQGNPLVYANSFKIAIAREYLTGNLGYGRLANKHGVTRRTVIYFVKWYKTHYPDGNADNPPVTCKSQTEQELSKQLKEANFKIVGLEMLIETAQKELGIDIVKKPGTKQS